MGVGESHWKSSLLSDSLKPKMKLFPLSPALFLSSVPVQVEWRIPTFPVLSQELFGRWSKSYPSLCWIAGTKRGWCQDTFPFSLGYFWRKLHTELQEPSSQVARSASHWHACILKPFLSAKVWESIMANMPLLGWSTHRPSPADQEAVCQRRLLNWPHGESLHEVSEKGSQKRSLLWCKQLWNPCIVFFLKHIFQKLFVGILMWISEERRGLFACQFQNQDPEWNTWREFSSRPTDLGKETVLNSTELRVLCYVASLEGFS